MVDDLLRLDGQNAIIGGATGGIGKGIAKKFSEAGADLLLISRSEEKLKQLLLELNNSNHRYLVANYEDPYKLEEIVRNELESYLNDGGNPCEDYFVSACLKNKPTFREVLTFCIDNGYMYPLNDEAPFGLHNPWGSNPQKGQGKYYEDIKKVCPEIVKLEELNGI